MTRDGLLRRYANDPGVFRYAVVCLAALGVILVVMLQRTFWSLAMVPVLAGLVGGVTRLGPFLLPAAVAVALNAIPFTERASAQRSILDGLVAAAVLAYAAGHYRLQGLLSHIYPADPRRREEPVPRSGWFRFLPRRPAVVQFRRTGGLVSAEEISRLLLMLPLWAVFAQVIWNGLPLGANPGLVTPVWQLSVLAWLIGLSWYVAAAVLDYAGWRQATPAEAALYLQDTLWAETRREQRRLNRWLAWGRRRAAPK